MPIDESAKKSYIDGGGLHCPFCRSKNIESGPIETSDSGLPCAHVHCEDCGKEWVDWYFLQDVDEVE